MQTFTLNWAGGEHEFALRLGELEALQESCGAGPGEVLGRLAVSAANKTLVGTWRVADVFDTIKLGLIGGGMERQDAADLVRTALDRSGFIALIVTAADILSSALMGPSSQSSEQEGEALPEKPEAGATTPADGISEPSSPEGS